MRKKTPYETGGFAFSDEKMMEKAVKEAEGVEFVRSRIDMKNPETVLQIYRQTIERQLFETPVGYAFLYELQEYLKTSTSIEPEYIPAIPVVNKSEEAQLEKVKREKKQKEKPAREKKIVNVNYKGRFHTSFFINIIMLLMIIGMFAVAATSENVNILNYENALIEKYEMWENELEEREDNLEQREAELREAVKEM
ncbi:MAG: hypothetical protein J6A92_01450 [Lachnospiraceae bacterium]|nr:hypothetical protein [Lachnospiraceae bacterium]